MKHAAWFLTFLCAVAFCQSVPPDNAPGRVIPKPLKTLRPAPVFTPEPSMCAIPLLSATPRRFTSQMPALKLPSAPAREISRGGIVQGMPACDEKFFRNK